MIRLGHAVDAAVAGHKAEIRHGVSGLKPRGERRTEVPVDVPEVPSLRVRPVALRADPGVPVVGGRRGRIGGTRPLKGSTREGW